MKLFRFGPLNNEKPGVVLANGTMIDVSNYIDDYNEGFFANNGIMKLQEVVAKHGTSCPVVKSDVRLGSCVARPSKIICIGLNYAKHAKETNATPPKEPVLFFKSTTALCGPNDNVIIPKNSKATDWEVELAVIIGKKASYIDLDNALDYVAGYAVHNDYSERDFQLHRSGQWCKGKGCDTFAPLGPYLVTKDEVANPQKLNLWLKLNGETLQQSSTDDMIFDIKFIIHHISQFMTLLPGDVISTGTPAGVGLGFKPPKYLKAGDVVNLGIDMLGSQTQLAVNYTK
jgi:2,4-diketo-3-deoxy-L-fuconate hydrolase